MSIIIRAHFDGRTIVPDTDLDLQADQPLEVQLRLLTPAETKPTDDRCEKPDIMELPFFGMWADREDMSDGQTWVRKERDKWISRTSDKD